MLKLTRRPKEAIIIDGDIKVIIKWIKGNKVSVGIDAPDEVEIVREELLCYE